MERKRKSSRRALKVYLKVLDAKTGELVGYLVDVHKEGLQLTSENSIAAEVPFQLRLELPVEIEGQRVVLFSATSKWSEKDPESNFYNSGFRLDEISDGDMQRMEQVMQKFCFSDP